MPCKVMTASQREDCCSITIKSSQGLNHNPKPSVWCLLHSTQHPTTPTKTQRRVQGRCREAMAIYNHSVAVGYTILLGGFCFF